MEEFRDLGSSPTLHQILIPQGLSLHCQKFVISLLGLWCIHERTVIEELIVFSVRMKALLPEHGKMGAPRCESCDVNWKAIWTVEHSSRCVDGWQTCRLQTEEGGPTLHVGSTNQWVYSLDGRRKERRKSSLLLLQRSSSLHHHLWMFDSSSSSFQWRRLSSPPL